jgi:hypothetical protein
MAEDTFYVSAGLEPSKENDETPTDDTYYIAAGLTPAVEPAAEGDNPTTTMFMVV